MRDVNGVRFYEGRDVSHAAVQAAQRRVGDQLEAERLARIAARPKPSRYGPHRPEDEPTFELVPVRVGWEWRHFPVDERVLQQRRRINDLAAKGSR